MAAKKGVVWFVFASIFVHAIMLVSLIDLYTIPREDGAKTRQFYPLRPPAKRLVVFVADGAFAESVFSVTEEGVSQTPFLRGVATRGGRWGVSHAAAANGYQTLFTGVPNKRGNLWRRAEQYDSLFAASIDTWYWSAGQQQLNNAEMFDTAHKMERGTIVSQITSSVERFFDPNNGTQLQLLSGEKLIFLIGFPATSQKTSDSLLMMDSAVEKIANLINTFYGDKETAFIFTSANDKLSSNTPYQTLQLPFISWGAGIKKARSSQKAEQHYDDGLADKWQLAKYERLDIQQEDAAPLMAAIIGVHTPVDSEGVLPAGYIHYNKAFDANSLFANARQLLELVRAKADWIESHSLPFLFRPFPELTKPAQEKQSVAIDELIKQRRLQESIHSSKQLIALCRQALSYYQSYHQTSLKLLLFVGFLGWVMCAVTILIQNVSHHGHKPVKHTLFVSPTGLLLCCVFCLLQLYQKTPLLHYVYACFPVVCWDYVIAHKTLFFCSLNTAARDSPHLLKGLCSIVFLVSCAEFVALNSIFPWLLSVALMILSLWPYVTTELIQKAQWRFCLCWTTSCICLAVIPLFPETYNTIITLISLFIIVAVCLILFSNPQSRHLITTPRSSLAPCNCSFLFVFQVVVLCFCAWMNPRLTTSGCSQHFPFPWCVIVLSVVPVVIGSCSIVGRLLHVFLGMGTLLSAFGSSYELFFLTTLAATLFSWLRTEELVTDVQKVASVWHGILCVRKTAVATLVPGEERVVKAGLLADEMRRIGFLVVFGGYSFFVIFQSQCYSPQDDSWLTSGVLLASLPLLAVTSVNNVILCIFDQSYKTSALLWLAVLDIIGLTFYMLIHDQGDWQVTVTQLSMYVGAVGVLPWSCLLFIVTSCLSTGRSVVPRKLEEHSL